jgi:hypothetical protein
MFMPYNDHAAPVPAAAEVKEPVAQYYTVGMGNAVAEPDESVLGEDWDEDGCEPVSPERAAAIRIDPEYIAWKEDIIRSLIESEEDVKAGRYYPLDEVVDEILRDIENDQIFEKLQQAEANRLAGARTYTISEVSERLRERINGKK